jgi:peptide/nickel transport system substrate-binding protein
VNALLSSINLYPYNLAKAKAEMAESAYPHGFSATLLAVNYAVYVNVSQVLAAELGRIGIKVQLKEETLAASEADVAPEQRLAHFSEYGCLSPVPNWFNLQLSSSQIALDNNVANYWSPAVDHLLTVGGTTSDRAKRFAAYSAIVRQLAVDVPYVPLFDPEVGLALSSKFSYPSYSYWSVVDDYPLGVKLAS